MIWKYIIRDLNGAIQYLPYGVMAGAVMGLILNAMNARRERKGKEAFPMAGLMVFFFVPHDHTGDHFFLQRGWQPEPCHGSGAFLHLGDQYEK